jgi:hypothetical protein
VSHNIFAMELCLQLEPDSTLRKSLHELIVDQPGTSTLGEKWKTLGRAIDLLTASERLFVKGCWDFFDDDARARRDYDMWCNGMITEEGARPEPSGPPGTHADEQRFMTFTISLLLKADTPSAQSLAKICFVQERDLWKRKTFLRILRGLKSVSYAAVKSDVLYLIPGHERWGLTAKDLEATKFEYLREIE